MERLIRTLQHISNVLEETYGEPLPMALEDPLDSLIGTILSQNTTDIQSDKVFLELKRTFKRWEDVPVAPRRLLENVLRPGGLAREKAKAIRETLVRLSKMDAELRLDFL